tara:strand:+ start:252 stop:860 length:609 start_codon:yes stop_codon:yes gene_type:complete
VIEFIPIFPSPVFKIDTNSNFKDIRSDLINFCYSEKEKDIKGINRSNYNGWHSTVYTNEEKFKKYKSFIEDHLKVSLNKFLNDGTNFSITSAWININGKKSSNSMHCHPGSDLSGCLWIKATDKSGSFRFNNPNDFVQDALLHFCNNETKSEFSFSNNYWFKPVEGFMIVFPSHINHCVFENHDDEDRISIAFNILFKQNEF